jgi:hypothetical protein
MEWSIKTSLHIFSQFFISRWKIEKFLQKFSHLTFHNFTQVLKTLSTNFQLCVLTVSLKIFIFSLFSFFLQNLRKALLKARVENLLKMNYVVKEKIFSTNFSIFSTNFQQVINVFLNIIKIFNKFSTNFQQWCFVEKKSQFLIKLTMFHEKFNFS